MIKPISVKQTKEITSVFDKEKEKTVFVIRPLDAIEMAEIEDAMTITDYKGQSVKQQINYATKRIDIIRHGLVAIKGKDWPNEVSDEVIKLIPQNVIIELSTEIENLSTLSPEEQEGLAL